MPLTVTLPPSWTPPLTPFKTALLHVSVHKEMHLRWFALFNDLHYSTIQMWFDSPLVKPMQLIFDPRHFIVQIDTLSIPPCIQIQIQIDLAYRASRYCICIVTKNLYAYHSALFTVTGLTTHVCETCQLTTLLGVIIGSLKLTAAIPPQQGGMAFEIS